MKRRTAISAKIALLTVFLPVFMMIAIPLPAQQPYEPVGFVVAIRGKAMAYDKQGNTRTLSMKSPVYEHDELKTGPRGRIQVLFSDNTIVSLGRESTIEIAEYVWKPDDKTGAMKTKVKEGVFRVMGGAITREAPKNFTTETPAATIGIRGSMYAGKVSAGQLMVVFEGGKGIDVSNGVGSISITRPGYGTHVMGSDLPPLPPKSFSKDELSELNSQLSTDPEPEEQTDDTSATSDAGESEPQSGETEESTESSADSNQENQDEQQDQETAETQDTETTAGDETPEMSETDDSQAGDSTEEPVLQDNLESYEETPADAASLTDPLSSSVTEVSQDVIETSTTASQDDLEDTVTQTSQTGITLTGAYVAQCTADMTTTDFATWYSDTLQATSTDGNVTGSATNQDSTVFEFSFTKNPYDPDATYEPPFDASGNPITDIQSRYVGLSGVDQTFDSVVISDNLGEFAIFGIKDALFIRNTVEYGYRDLGFAGIETQASQIPTDGISGYFGFALGVDIELATGKTMHIETELMNLFTEVNWLNGKAIGKVYSSEGGDIFFFADVSGSALTNVTFCGYTDKDDGGTNNIVSWVQGTVVTSQFYGSSYQGIGVSGTGEFYDIGSDQTTSIGSGRMVAAAFRELDIDEDATSPTGTVTFQGFVTGLAENMDDIYTDRRLFMNSDTSDFNFTVDREAGTLSGTLSAVDIVSGTTSVSSLEIGMSHGSAYVLDDNMVAMIGDTGSDAIESGSSVGGLKTYGNYLVTGDIDDQFSEYVTWGYWEIAYEDPESGGQYHLHMPGSYWVAGELTPDSTITDMASSNISGTYSGGAKGICINTASEISELTNGTSQIQVDFGSYQVTGNITFDEISLPLSGGTVSASTSSFFSGITGATSSSVNGAFFGPQAEAVGGNFNAEVSGSTYMGIFGGERPTSP